MEETRPKPTSPRNPTNHNQHRRASWHNYSEPCFYMLTLVVRGRRPLFGRLVEATPAAKTAGHWTRKTGNEAETAGHGTGSEAGAAGARVELSPFGQRLRDEELPKIPRFYPNVYIRHLCIMPDHLHVILRVKEAFPEGKHLGSVVAGFKAGVNRLFRSMTGATEGVFEEGYNDRILYHTDQLDAWKRYLDDNPRRLWMKRERPDLFTVLRDFDICGRRCQIVGNQFLMDIPDKVAVVVHRRYSDEDFQRLRREWLACGERGGVIIGTAIAPREKEVMREAMDCGYRVILLRENGFPQLYKPSGAAFDACAAGQLLQVSPWGYHNERQTITRQQCLSLNALAEAMAAASKPGNLGGETAEH